ncbi:MAG: Re/Si-specific NAD(P)(+) transhydrogenase subunit alpha [Bradymonadaceae bacterium]|nr:Re/Si-specific NAD(P)(+) transhydrogenase subunit alpha [Lujinxingiaceae bacterium]
MKIGIPREIDAAEKRVAAIPQTVAQYTKMGYEVLVEAGAGAAARLSDQAFEAAGATIVADAAELWASADVILKVRPPAFDEANDRHEADLLGEGKTLISLIWPAQNQELVGRLAERKATVLALDCIPRISRAQAMDVLSSQAGISGYRAVLEAAHAFGRCFGAQFTAAGKTEPARVLVIGAGVAGLAAIAAARELGAIVYAFDTRAAVKEEIETLGARVLEMDFVESGDGGGGYAKVMSQEFIDAEMALFLEQAPITDIVITTAAIPGKPAPLLVKREMVEAMRAGSVVVDLAAETGGNCELTVAGELVDHQGVTIIGFTDLTSRLPTHASEFFSRNVAHLVNLLGSAEEFKIDLEDEIIYQMIVLDAGKLMWPPPKVPAPAAPVLPVAAIEMASPSMSAPTVGADDEPRKSQVGLYIGGALGLALLLCIGLYAPTDFIQHFSIFVLACFVGWKVIWNVKASLHTPLMSVTNAISGIIILGGILQVTTEGTNLVVMLGAAATLVASINVFGGFLVTQRMLKMFRSDKGARGGSHA